MPKILHNLSILKQIDKVQPVPDWASETEFSMQDTLLTYTGKINSPTDFRLPKRLRQEVFSAFGGKEVEVTFRRLRKRRTTPQNRYYWGVVLPEIMRGMIDLGNDAIQMGNAGHAEAVHEFLKANLLDNGDEVTMRDGSSILLSASTTKCSTVEMEDYLERVRRWAAEYLGIAIPLPNEQTEMFAA